MNRGEHEWGLTRVNQHNWGGDKGASKQTEMMNKSQ